MNNERTIGVAAGTSGLCKINAGDVISVDLASGADNCFITTSNMQYEVGHLADSFAYSMNPFGDSHTVAKDPSPYDNTVTTPLSLNSLKRLEEQFSQYNSNSITNISTMGFNTCGPCDPSQVQAERSIKLSKLTDEQKELYNAGLISIEGDLSDVGAKVLLRLVFDSGAYEDEMLEVAEAINEHNEKN